MSIKDRDTAMAVVIQTALGTFDAPTDADRYPFANLSFDIAGVTVANPEYNGGVLLPPDQVIGKKVSFSYDIMMRPPGGATPPAAGAWIPGRILRAAKFTENRVATAITEALGSGSTTTMAVLGAGAAATAGLYKGLVLSLGSTGTYRQKLTPIRAYSASKQATLCRTLGSAPSGNYTLPAQLAYQLSITTDDAPILSHYIWRAGKKWSLKDCRVTGFTLNMPTTTVDGGELPSFRVTFEANIETYIDEAAPQVAALGAVPVFRDGENIVAHYPIGGQSVTIDIGGQSAATPNPNQPTGSNPASLVTIQPVLNFDWNATLKAELDTLALADAGASHPYMAQWGYTAGNVVCVNMPDMKFDIPAEGTNGPFVTQTGRMLTEVADRPLTIAIPF